MPRPLARPGKGLRRRSGLIEGCRDYLLLVANRRMSDDLRAKAGASDIVQDILMKVCRSFPQFRGQTEAELHLWLRLILRRHLANVGRRYRDTAKPARPGSVARQSRQSLG